jgi:hypothetical protein
MLSGMKVGDTLGRSPATDTAGSPAAPQPVGRTVGRPDAWTLPADLAAAVPVAARPRVEAALRALIEAALAGHDLGGTQPGQPASDPAAFPPTRL